jgi:hypothetical protein
VPETPHPRRRTFGPAVLLGVLAGVAGAVAGTQPWFAGDGSRTAGDGGYESGLSMTFDGADVPAVNALALVGLACWGVVLVTRGRFRQYVAVLGLLAAAGAVVAVVDAWLTVPDALRASFDAMAMADRDVSSTGWSWIGSAAAVVGVVTWLAAARFVRHWPEMGRRYDAPQPGTTPSDHDLWKVMDEGRDPTS